MNKQELNKQLSDFQDIAMISESEMINAENEQTYIQSSNDLKAALEKIIELKQQLESLGA